MDGSVLQTWSSDILHAVTQGLLVPDIVLLLAFIFYALFCIGSIVVEYFTERKHFQVTMPKFLAALMGAEEDAMPAVIEESGLLRRQKVALLTVYDYRMLPGDALVALIRRLVSEEESRYDRITGRNNMAARVSPMLGLMGTLIPLGPGITALGEANTELLSASLLIAFDTTVAGLVVAAVCMVIGKIRGIWYGNYMSALDSAMATMLQKIEDMRAEGKIVVKEPSDYAFLFEQTHDAKAKGKSGEGEGAGEGEGDAAAAAGKPAKRPSIRSKLAKGEGAKGSAGEDAATSSSRSTASAPGLSSAAGAAGATASASNAAPLTTPSGMPVTTPLPGSAKQSETASGSSARADLSAHSNAESQSAAVASSSASVWSAPASAASTGAIPAVTPARAADVTSPLAAISADATGPISPAPADAGVADAPAASTQQPKGAASPTGHEASPLAAIADGSAPVMAGISADQFSAPVTYTPTAPAGAEAAHPAFGAVPSFTYEPYRPTGADAAFAPVPDPAFITDLAAAAEANPGAAAGAGDVPSAEGATGSLDLGAAPESSNPAVPAHAASSVPTAADQAQAQAKAGAHAWYNPRKQGE